MSSIMLIVIWSVLVGFNLTNTRRPEMLLFALMGLIVAVFASLGALPLWVTLIAAIVYLVANFISYWLMMRSTGRRR